MPRKTTRKISVTAAVKAASSPQTAFEHFIRMRDALEAQTKELEELQDRLTHRANKIEELHGKIAGLEAVRQYTKAGRMGEALHVLDRMLQEADPNCTRTAAVAPMLPIAGSFGA